MSIIRVAMAQFSIAKKPDCLETQALGSCVGIALYDPYVKVGGLSHAMLPDINEAKESSRSNPGKFVNSSIDELLELMMKEGAGKAHIKAKLTGGANMFPDITRQDMMHVGRRNVEAAKNKLSEMKIAIIAEDTGGSIGRTITLDTNTGRLKVRSIAQGEREI